MPKILFSRPILCCLGLACLAAAAGCSRFAEPEEVRFRALMDRIWDWDMEQFPEWATAEGKRTGLDRWTDCSEEAIAAREAQTGVFLKELEAIWTERLSPGAQLDCRLLVREYREEVEGKRFPGELLALNQLGGVHQEITDLMREVPAERPEDFDALLARLRAVPRLVEQNIRLLERGLAQGVTPPRVTLGAIPAQLDALLAEDSLENPILAPFQKPAPLLAETQREAYRTEGLRVFRESVLPALRAFRSFVADRYIPGARESLGMAGLPEGREWYAFRARSSTTTALSPGEIHELGLREVARLRIEMEAAMRRTGFKGDARAFKAKLHADPAFVYGSEEALLAGYRDICKRADAALPAFFGKLPRLPYGVRAIPAYAAPSKPAAYYEPGSLEAGRPGYFWANTSKLATRPKWQMEALALHEAVPGHHLQIALAKELEEKHELLRQRFYTAFSEGWALYCEGLGKEMGFYQDPWSDYGRLNYEMWRAVRLVVDTGLHDRGWTREQAIAYFQENTAFEDSAIQVEVDRYLVWPGQALAYKIGELKIRELRARAEKKLGTRFDLRAFHDALLAEGGLPLDVLEQRMEDWTDRRDKAGKEAARSTP
jgi:uncharacterized protein (DUF885 family)